MHLSIRAFLPFAICSAAVVACAREAPDLRDWKASDHDRTEESSKQRAAPARAQPGASASANVLANTTANAMVTLVEVTWRNQCAPCHGVLGRGDGPQGPMVHAPDLTSPEWQAKVTDQQIARTITTGKNRMPKFEFAPDVLGGLVSRIRAAKGLKGQ